LLTEWVDDGQVGDVDVLALREREGPTR
jgi:hypothetical protein